MDFNKLVKSLSPSFLQDSLYKTLIFLKDDLKKEIIFTDITQPQEAFLYDIIKNKSNLLRPCFGKGCSELARGIVEELRNKRRPYEWSVILSGNGKGKALIYKKLYDQNSHTPELIRTPSPIRSMTPDLFPDPNQGIPSKRVQSYQNKVKLISKVSSSFISDCLPAIEEFLEEETRASLLFDGVKEDEARFLHCIFNMAKTKKWHGLFSNESQDLLNHIDVLKRRRNLIINIKEEVHKRCRNVIMRKVVKGRSVESRNSPLKWQSNSSSHRRNGNTGNKLMKAHSISSNSLDSDCSDRYMRDGSEVSHQTAESMHSSPERVPRRDQRPRDVRNRREKDRSSKSLRSKASINKINFESAGKLDDQPIDNTKPFETTDNSKDNRATNNRVSKDKKRIMEAMSVPLESDRAMRMMLSMGWEGGALGTRGEGITVPIMPKLDMVTGAGLGHIKGNKQRESRRKRSDKRDRHKRNDEHESDIDSEVDNVKNKNKKETNHNKNNRKEAFEIDESDESDDHNIRIFKRWNYDKNNKRKTEIRRTTIEGVLDLLNSRCESSKVIYDGGVMDKEFDYVVQFVDLINKRRRISYSDPDELDVVRNISQLMMLHYDLMIECVLAKNFRSIKFTKVDTRKITLVDKKAKTDQVDAVKVANQYIKEEQLVQLAKDININKNKHRKLPAFKVIILETILEFIDANEEYWTVSNYKAFTRGQMAYLNTLVNSINTRKKIRSKSLSSVREEYVYNAVFANSVGCHLNLEYNALRTVLTLHKIKYKKRFTNSAKDKSFFKIQIQLGNNSSDAINNETADKTSKPDQSDLDDVISLDTNEENLLSPRKENGDAMVPKNELCDIKEKILNLKDNSKVGISINCVIDLNMGDDDVLAEMMAKHTNGLKTKNSQTEMNSKSYITESRIDVEYSNPAIKDNKDTKNINNTIKDDICDINKVKQASPDCIETFQNLNISSSLVDEDNLLHKVDASNSNYEHSCENNHVSNGNESMRENGDIINACTNTEESETISTPSPSSKRTRSDSVNSDCRFSKKCRIYYKKVSIKPVDSTDIDVETAKKFQNLITNSIKQSKDVLPMLKCHGIINGSLVYSCHNEHSYLWLENIVADIFEIADFTENGKSTKCRVAIKLNSYIQLDAIKFLNRLEKYNPKLKTANWHIVSQLDYKDFVLIVVELDNQCYQAISEMNFKMFAGVDEAQFFDFSE